MILDANFMRSQDMVHSRVSMVSRVLRAMLRTLRHFKVYVGFRDFKINKCFEGFKGFKCFKGFEVPESNLMLH